MRLTKLELHGFKSFADHTEMLFDEGATMIVGPNGCGKSNVSDAVRWVLGEHRARAMRGAKMEDVIFQGSSARRPVNLAEVSLHFENEDGALPVPFKEVVITRRLSRSGDSDYLLNRAPCRLRDIHDLLRGTGLGGDAGVVIESKAIDALLSDRPDDRRDLFEEAAGVGLYRDRRRSTERRLEETTGDLQRLDDLINEVQTQVRSLARQRKRAERHAEIMARRFAVDLTLAQREMEAWAGELTRLEGRVAELRQHAPAAEEGVLAAEQERETAHGARAAAEAQRNELARLVAGLRQSALTLQGEMAVAEERQRNALARRQRAEEERREGESIGERVEGELDRARAERADFEQALRVAADELEQRTALEEETRAAVAAARAAAEQAERRIRETRDGVRRAEIDREAAARELAEVEQRAEALDAERRALADALALVRRETEEAEGALAVARDQVAAAGEELDAARLASRAARDVETTARAELFRVDEAHTSLQGKFNALEALERERVGLAPAAARLLRERDQFPEGTVVGPVSDFITASAEWALLVEKFLGATLHAIVVRDADAAEAVRRWHAANNPGPLLLLPLDAMPDDEALVDEGDMLARHVEATGAGRAWVRALLGHARAVENGSAFVDARGAVFLPGAAAGPGPLRRRAELAELRKSLAQSERARAAAVTAAEAAREALTVAETRVTAAGEAANEASQLARRADEHRGEIARRQQRAERDLGEAEALAGRLRQRQETLAERSAELDARANELGEALAVQERELAEGRARLEESERLLEEAREMRTVCQVQQAQAQARLQVAADRERRLGEEQRTAAQRLEALQAELSTLSAADSVLAEQMASWQLDLEMRRATLQDAETRLSDAEEAVRTADAALEAAEHTLAETRRRAGTAAEELHAAELRFTELSGRRAAIRERLETEWRKPLEDLLRAVEPLELDDESLRAEAEELRRQVDTLGPVNPLAIEEHEEEVKRLDFLTSQRTDLHNAKASLLQAIREIDTTARELFLATFTQVRENFRQIFMTLFGGGECDLRLENAEDPLNCDIEIHASPRGKRTQRIHLLSSGERNLVALSLLFGIFLTKPSPFCLMDEVDAPLDDQNVGRFVRMLNQFKTQTQFVVITHNPRTTTEAADAVYGVTMQEPGVSSLVSVRMRANAVEEAISGRATAAREPAGAGA